jgi:hypothetical protein
MVRYLGGPAGLETAGRSLLPQPLTAMAVQTDGAMRPARFALLVPALQVLVFLALFASPAGAGADGTLYGELNVLAGHSEQNRWIGEGPGGLKNSAGFEYFGKASNDYGDYLTWDLQARLGYHTGLASDDRWGLEIHNAWVEYKLGLGRNIRAGHFSPAFGLEPGVDTHGTLFQTLAMWDIGFKKDWGIGYRGAVSALDYSVALQLGSGMTIDRKDGSYLATARVGTPPGGDLEWGLSLLAGYVLESAPMRTVPRPEVSDRTTAKRRAGVDARYRRGSFLLLGEATVGTDEAPESMVTAGSGETRGSGGDAGSGEPGVSGETTNVAGVLFQTDYTVPSLQSMVVRFQGRFWTDDTGDAESKEITLGLGGSYALLPGWKAAVAVFHDLARPGEMEDTRFYVQVYYFGRWAG